MGPSWGLMKKGGMKDVIRMKEERTGGAISDIKNTLLLTDIDDETFLQIQEIAKKNRDKMMFSIVKLRISNPI